MTTRKIGRKTFKPYDAFETKQMAKEYAEQIRKGDKCSVRVIRDKAAGRLKWVIWVDSICRHLV